MKYLGTFIRHLPLILCVMTPISMFITYTIAVVNGHVHWLWPYISDTGTTPPESCIFGLLLSAISYIMCGIIYLRYREVSEYMKLYPLAKISPTANIVATIFGTASALGLHMVASFQETNQFVTHITGALLCFISATIFFTFQTVFTRKMQPAATAKFWIRLVLTVLCVVFIIGTFAPIGPALHQFTGKNKLQWTPDSGGYPYHLASTFCEWLLVFSFCLYILTLHWDFKKLRLEIPRIQFIALEGEAQTSKSNAKSP